MMRSFAALVGLIAVAYGAVPAGHAVSPSARAAIAREATRMLAQPGVRHVGFYGFTVDRAGHVLSEWVVRPSGSSRLDRLALAAIGKAVLKRLPTGSARMQFIEPIEFRRHGVMAKVTRGTGAP